MSEYRLRVRVGEEIVASVPVNRTVSSATAEGYARLVLKRWKPIIAWEIRKDGEVVKQGEMKGKVNE